MHVISLDSAVLLDLYLPVTHSHVSALSNVYAMLVCVYTIISMLF